MLILAEALAWVSYWGFVIALVGLVAGLVSLIWRILDHFATFLQIGLVVKRDDKGLVIAQTTVQNKNASLSAKRIHSAFLVVGPEGEDEEVFNRSRFSESRPTCGEPSKVLPAKLTIDYGELSEKPATVVTSRAFLPLDFYSVENVNIADEAIGFTSSIPTKGWGVGTYSVRFVVVPAASDDEDSPPSEEKLPRITQDLFVVRTGDEGAALAGGMIGGDRNAKRGWVASFAFSAEKKALQ